MMKFLQGTGLQTSARAPTCGQGRQTGSVWGHLSYTAMCVQRDRHTICVCACDLSPDAQQSSACCLSVLILALENLEFLSLSRPAELYVTSKLLEELQGGE